MNQTLVYNNQGHGDSETGKIRKPCPQFRVLVVGKANSGKTSILHKLRGPTDTVTVRDRNGRQIDSSILDNPTPMRGIHDIEHQISFSNHPGFVFHDSGGFEQGSVEEIEKVQGFIQRRSSAKKLKDGLHAIWYCVPMDHSRVLSIPELSFFDYGTGGVPIIVLFTKWDGQIIKSASELYERGMKMQEAKQEAPKHAMATLENGHLPVVMNTAYPPASYVIIGSMHKPETTIPTELIKKTTTAIDVNIPKILGELANAPSNRLRVREKLSIQVRNWRDNTSSSSSISVRNRGWRPSLCKPLEKVKKFLGSYTMPQPGPDLQRDL